MDESQHEKSSSEPARARPGHAWLTRSVLAIIVATFFSDVGHEMVTAVLPLYLGSIGLGAAALGVMEGLADLLFSLSKLAGGYVGHHVRRKKPWGTAGYLATAIGTAALGLLHTVAALVSLRALAWFGRGFRSPLRDFILADSVEPTHFGRAYGVERTSDMLGAVAGPLVATALVGLGIDLRVVIVSSFLPSALAVISFLFTTEKTDPRDGGEPKPRAPLPRIFWSFLGGVFLFGLGDFSRTFLILLAAAALAKGHSAASAASIAMLLYAVHNGVSALAAYPAGHAGDRASKLGVLLVGYALGVVTNLLLLAGSDSLFVLVPAIVLSGIYIAILETIEKAAAAEMLVREQRSLGFGILASANALGDMVSSLVVGLLLHAGHVRLAFGLPAIAGLAGVVWLIRFRRGRARVPAPSDGRSRLDQ